MRKFLVSVIIPVYNGEEWLERCVESARNQTCQDLEIIIVDDGSTDESGEICDRLATSDSRIRVIHQQNGGVNSARRKGVENASGEWLVFLDADDALPRNAVELYSAYFQNGSEILVQGRMNGLMYKDEYLQCLMKGDVGPALWGKAFKADFYKAHCPSLSRELMMGEDLIINLAVGITATSVRYVKGELYEVNAGNSKSVTKVFKKTWAYEKMYFATMEDLFLSKCGNLDCYDCLELLVRKSQLNGIKYVMLSGNKIKYSDEEFRRLKQYFSDKKKELGPSERLIFLLRNAGMYRFVMKLYLRTIKNSK